MSTRRTRIPTCHRCGATLIPENVLDDGMVDCPRCPAVWDPAEVIP